MKTKEKWRKINTTTTSQAKDIKEKKDGDTTEQYEKWRKQMTTKKEQNNK